MPTDKYAVYVVVVEDTESADQSLAVGVDGMERIGGNFDWTEAEAVMLRVPDVNHDKALEPE